MIIADVVLPYVTSALSRYEGLLTGFYLNQLHEFGVQNVSSATTSSGSLASTPSGSAGASSRARTRATPRSFRARDTPPTWSTSTGTTRDADLHADLNVLGSVPIGSFDCVILTPVMQFLFPETACMRVFWASPAPTGGVLMLTAPSLARVDPHDPSTDFWLFTPNGLAKLLHRLGMPASVAGYGNVLACVASLWGAVGRGLSAEAGRRRPALFPGRLRTTRREGEVTRPPVVDQRASAARARLPAAIGWLTVAPPAVSAAARVAAPR